MGTPSGRSTISCSPRTRGWSRAGLQRHLREVLLPAHAGMVPPASHHSGRGCPAPRVGGDGPRLIGHRLERDDYSPRTRGLPCSHRGSWSILEPWPSLQWGLTAYKPLRARIRRLQA
ncbi:hypothetical protein B9S64_10435 [Streptomyces sp. SM18]|nr:hypothetical protein B9S64_10435 [Streptomyces sp. SM18]